MFHVEHCGKVEKFNIFQTIHNKLNTKQYFLQLNVSRETYNRQESKRFYKNLI